MGKIKAGTIVGFLVAETAAILLSIGTIGYMIDKEVRDEPKIVVTSERNYSVDKTSEGIDLLADIQQLSPYKVEQHNDYTYYYYTAEEIAKLDHHCDSAHMQLTYDEFLELTEDVRDNIQFTGRSNSDDIYISYCKGDNYVYTRSRFSSSVQESANHDFVLQVEYDSVTHEIHYFTLQTNHYDETFKDNVYGIFDAVLDGHRFHDKNGKEIDLDQLVKKYDYDKTKSSYYETYGDLELRVFVSDDYVDISVHVD